MSLISLIQRPIFLIGYRATGKSCAGKLLAEKVGLPFCDMDNEITAHEEMSIRQIVQNSGWKEFRALERKLLSELMASGIPIVVACGGGAVLHEDLFRKADKNIHTIWLAAEAETIAERLMKDSATDENRPALEKNLSPQEEIRKMMQERLHLYMEFSHLKIDTDRLTIKNIVHIILQWLEKGAK